MLEHLAIAGGYHGIYAADGADSDRLTVSNCLVYGHPDSWGHGIYLGSSNDNARIINNTARDVPRSS